jgi:membrane-associated phospholipid phosphatase
MRSAWRVARMMRFRRSELMLASYFVYVAVVALLRPIASDVRVLIVTTNLALMFWFALFAWAHAGRGFSVLDHVRDFFPLPLILLAYREMGWLALPHPGRAFENSMVLWDRLLLTQWGLRAAVESLGLTIPLLLELSYLLVYVVPVLMVEIFYLTHARERIDDAYSILLFGTLSAYALYPYFPSEPPRTVFPNADLPLMTLARQWNLRICGDYGIHTSVFPSGHSAAAFSAAIAVWRLLPKRRVLGVSLFVLAGLIGLATVYGRYHFAVDTLAGIALAGLGGLLSLGWQSTRRPR